MADRPQRRTPTPKHATVTRTERLTPHMIRVVLAVDPAAELEIGAYTDHYVKLVFPPEGVTYPEPLDVEAIRRDLPREQWPRTRTYTVRAWDAATREMTVDFVHHGDEGLAGPWAAGVTPGEGIHFMGPGGGYAPDPAADWHLLVGDERAARPRRGPGATAAGRAREGLRRGRRARGGAEAALPGDAEIVWLHRGDRPVGEALVEAVTALEFPPGDPQAFVHGEAHFVKERMRLLVDHQVRASGCPSPATGGAAPTRTAGSPRSASGTPRWNASRSPPDRRARTSAWNVRARSSGHRPGHRVDRPPDDRRTRTGPAAGW